MLITVVACLGYCVGMRQVSKIIVALACFSFLTITLSGFHIHADAVSHGESGPHGHVHSYLASPDLDDDHVDVCLFEPATEFSKSNVVALFVALTIMAPTPRSIEPVTARRQLPLREHHERWRPELRAPPSFS
jgi:hypothetical protein